MSTDNTCPQCHTALPADAPAGLCPRCLIKSAAGFGDAPTVVTGADLPNIADAADVALRLPQFEIIELLGQGGMGVVYEARQPALDRTIALKILPPAEARSPDFVERFRREARALAKLSHPNIVAVYECGEAGGLYYFAMEYVDGANLRALLRERRLTPAEALAIVPRVCDALEYAHGEGVIHRDIKPENLLLDKKGRVKIADFGLAKLLRREALDITLTLSGAQLGTLRYMAPEQMEKPETVDHRADIYSLGVVIYEMLTGEVPMGRFAPPSERAQVDVRLDEIVLRSLERDVERRYQHASEVRTDVENVTASAPLKRPPAPVVHADAVPQKGLITFLQSALWFTLVVGGIIFWWPDTWTEPAGSFGSLRTVTIGASDPWLIWREVPYTGHILNTNFFTWSAFGGLCAALALAGLRALHRYRALPAAPGAPAPAAVFFRTALWFTLICGGIVFCWPATWLEPSGSGGSLRVITIGASVPWLEWRESDVQGHTLRTWFFTWSALGGLCALLAAAGLRATKPPGVAEIPASAESHRGAWRAILPASLLVTAALWLVYAGQVERPTGEKADKTAGPVTPPRPAPGAEQIRVEDTALRLLAAIRDKEDNVLRELASDLNKGWPDALPHFAFKLRERHQHSFSGPFALWPAESLVEGDFAVVKCTSKETEEKLEGWYLGLFFIREKNGAWRNAALAGTTADMTLTELLADFKIKNLPAASQPR